MRAEREVDEFQPAVVDLAQILGWRVAHFRPARTERGWRTAVSADGKGFPDLVLVKFTVVYAELKAERGRLSPDQIAWQEALLRAGQEHYVWRPSQWASIEERLRRG